MNLLRSLFVTGVLAISSMSLAGEMPTGWIKAGSHPGQYDMGVDRSEGRRGRNVAFIKGTADHYDGFGTIMQMASPAEYLGKRIRFSADVKSEKIEGGWAGLWLRLDGAKPGTTLGFDNMQQRPITGTTGWKRVEIVLDVPEETKAMGFGLLLAGGGEAWMDDLKFEVVASDVPVTGSGAKEQLSKPQNLDFEN